MSRLSELPNIGKIMEQRLNAVGIYDIETLKSLGSKEAFAKLRKHEGDTCLSALCGLEGAIQDTRWHHLSDDTKEDLKAYFKRF